VAPFVAGKNAIINGGMDIWQRGTSFAVTSAAVTFTADRWFCITGTGTATYSQETSIVPTNFRYAMKMLATATTQPFAGTVIETQNSLSFAGKTVVVSAQVAASTSTPMQVVVQYSTTVDETPTGASWVTITASSGGTATPTSTTYIPITGTYAVPSTAKTIKMYFVSTGNIANTVALYASGFQLELGAAATPFARAGGSIGGELALCQRYYFRNGGLSAYTALGGGTAENTTRVEIQVAAPVTMRTLPTAVDFSTIAVQPYGTGAITAVTSAVLGTVKGLNPLNVELNVASGLTQGVWYRGLTNNSTSGYLGFSAEL
jgi:hypothetical protein